MYLEPFISKSERKRISCLGLGVSADLIISALAYFLIVWSVRYLLPYVHMSEEVDQWIGSIAQYGIGFPAAYMVMTRVPADPIETKKISASIFVEYLLIISFLLTAGMLIGNGVNALVESIMGRSPLNPTSELLNRDTLVWTLLTTCILAPVTEELLFRKVLLDRVNRLGDTASILLSGFLFGAMHGNFYQFFYAMLVGMFFAYIYLNTGCIRYTIVLHMIVNFIFGVVPSMIQGMKEGLLRAMLDGAFGALELTVIVAGLVLFIRMCGRIRLLKGWLDADGFRIFRVIVFNFGMISFLAACTVQFALYLAV